MRLPPFVQVRYDARDRELPVEQRRVRFRGWALIGMKRFYGPTRELPLEAHRDAMRMRESEQVTPRHLVTLERAHEAMIAELTGVRRDGTVAFYEAQAKAVWRFVNKELPIQRLTAPVLQHMVKQAQDEYSARTLCHYRRYLHRLIEWCRRPQRGWFIGENPVPLVSWPEPQPAQPDVLTEAELAEHLTKLVARLPDYHLVLFMAYTGLRRAEVARLTVADFDLQRGFFRVRGKTVHEQAPITPETKDSIAFLLEHAHEGYLVRGVDTEYRKLELRRVQTIDRVFRRWAAECGDRRCHPHALRHTLATSMIRRGIHSKTVQRMLRHASASTTDIYVHLVAQDLHAAVGQLRFVKGGVEKVAEHG